MIFGFPLFEYVVNLLPGLFFMSLSILAPSIGLVLGVVAIRAKKGGAAFRHLVASSIAAGVSLFFLWDLLFNKGLSKGSTAGLAFLFIPVFSVGGLLAGYVLGFAVAFIVERVRRGKDSLFTAARVLFFIPAVALAISLFGILKESISSNDLQVSEKAMGSGALHYMLEKSKRPGANRFGITLFLAQNRFAPEDILAELSRSEFSQIRAQVANNPSTPISILNGLRNDCEEAVRKIIAKRLEGQPAANAVGVPSNCSKN